MRKIVPVLCAVVMLTAFTVPDADAMDIPVAESRNPAPDTDAILEQTCPEKWSCEGPYVDGKRHGNWVIRLPNGEVHEGPYMDGKKHGDWVIRGANGKVEEGPFANSNLHVNWVVRGANGAVLEGPVMGGKDHSNWVLRFPVRGVGEGPYVDRKKHSNWITIFSDGCSVYEFLAGVRVSWRACGK